MHLRHDMAEGTNQAVELQVVLPDVQRTRDTTSAPVSSQVINVPIDQVEEGSSCCLR